MIAFTDEQDAFRAALQDFCQRECGTRERRDTLTAHGRRHHNQALYEQMAQLGYVGVAIPEAFGGMGGGLVDLCIFLEETARGLAPVAAFGVSMIVAGAVERFGSPELKAEILGALAAGRPQCIAMSEPEAGSDVGALQCRAERGNGGYVVNGHKTWISEAHLADHVLTVVRTDAAGSKHEGLSMLCIRARGRASRSARSRRWAVRSSTTSSSPTATWTRTASWAARAMAGAS